MKHLPSTCAAVGLSALALLTGAPGAVAAAPGAARPTLTAETTAATVRAWQEFRIQGASQGLDRGTRVTLQQLQGERWVSLPASMSTTRSGTYSLRVKLGRTGCNRLRIVGGGAVSNVVESTVR